MYLVKRTTPTSTEYYKYDGWEEHTPGTSLDLTGVVLFTEGERKANTLRPNEEWLWYGAYKR